jgi:hypothetical protein
MNKMSGSKSGPFRRMVLRLSACCLGGVLLMSSCTDDDDDDYDHNPPDGMGAMIVDNRTFNDMAVYIDGTEYRKTEEDEWEAYDLWPGEYRIVLREKGGDHGYSGDVDILEDRLTVLEVQDAGYSDRDYDVLLWYD